MVLAIDPPLPCGTSRGNGICGKPATVAHVDPGTWPGYYLLLPVCPDCARELARVYGEEPEDVEARGVNGTAPLIIGGVFTIGGDGKAPRDAADAERRFYARYGAMVGLDWEAVQSWLDTSKPKPRTIEGWVTVAKEVRERQRKEKEVPNDPHDADEHKTAC